MLVVMTSDAHQQKLIFCSLKWNPELTSNLSLLYNTLIQHTGQMARNHFPSHHTHKTKEPDKGKAFPPYQLTSWWHQSGLKAGTILTSDPIVIGESGALHGVNSEDAEGGKGWIRENDAPFSMLLSVDCPTRPPQSPTVRWCHRDRALLAAAIFKA